MKQTYRTIPSSYAYYRTDYYKGDPIIKRRLPLSSKFALIFIASLLSVVFWQKWAHKNIDKTLTAASKAPAVSQKVHSPIDATQMNSQINAIIAGHPNIQISVGVVDIKTGKSYAYGVSEAFTGASVSKVLSAALFMDGVEENTHTMTESIGGKPAQYQLKQMIENSDNDAWQAFNDIMGHPALQEYAKSIGFTNYSANNNTITSVDTATLLQKLYTQKLLNAEHTKLLLSYMQKANEGSYIPATVPNGTKVYHKAGWLDDRVHDAAIIADPKRPYVLVIFTKVNGVYDTNTGQDIFHSITTATNKAFLSK